MHDLYGHIFVESTVAAIFLLGERSTRTFQKKKINSHAMYVRLAGTLFLFIQQRNGPLLDCETATEK
jgi:hypothetical protein